MQRSGCSVSCGTEGAKRAGTAWLVRWSTTSAVVICMPPTG